MRKTFTGADLVNAPGSLCWNEVLTRDADAGKAFYPAVFGWTAGRPGFEGALADCDATVATARELGATVTMEAMDMPDGRFAALLDPQGAALTVMQMTPAD